MSAPLLAVANLSVGYGQITALADLSLVVREGEAVALVGANGAGKSTLMRTVMGFLKPRAGGLRFAGREIADLAVERRARLGLGYCPEGRRVFPGLTVRENLEVAARADAATRAARLAEVFAIFPALAGKAAARAWQLSGGQQQMLAIGRALMGKPRLLLLDEPSLGLSPRLMTEVLDTVRMIAASGVAVLLAEQNVAKALEVCERAYLVEVGRVVEEGQAAALADSDAVRKAFLGG